jgi:hypothetical protein
MCLSKPYFSVPSDTISVLFEFGRTVGSLPAIVIALKRIAKTFSMSVGESFHDDHRESYTCETAN